MASQAIDTVLHENRVFDPPEAFRAQAHVCGMHEYERLYQEAADDPEKFWAGIASQLHWFKPWDKVLAWDCPWAKWFSGGELNLSYNCLDRHVATWRKNKAAIIWEGEPGEVQTLTYQQLLSEVSKCANVLTSLGLKKGDRVAIYMGMCPALAIAMLACARIGAPHTVVFGGFSAHALVDRINDSQASLVITQDGSYRRGAEVKLKPAVDEALDACPTVNAVVVFKRTGSAIAMKEGRDYWWHELMAGASDEFAAVPVESEHPLYLLYTSGTTGKPKGILHTTGGYAVGTYITAKWVFDLKDEDIFWCTADIGWVTGHSYIVYGPLQNGATAVMYEGAPNHPAPDRFWDMIDRHKVTVFYTAPTAIRAFMRFGSEWPQKHAMKTLRLLGTVGEPINPEAWMWCRSEIGRERCPIVDTWWQTETGMIMISPLPGATPCKPGSATRPLPGVIADVVTRDGVSVPPGGGGFLVLKQPWPAMLRTIWGDGHRFEQQYWSQLPGMYFTGDGARKDEDGYFWIMGRIDDVIDVSGHRLSTMEIESLAKPDDIRFSEALPKTRSGKLMRRLLREIAAGGDVKGDTTTLEDFSVIQRLRDDES
jgi:acetyl-CoA synthetase